MADGQIVGEGNKGRHIALLDGAAGSGTVDGQWVELCDHRNNVNIHFYGIVGETLLICGSNAPDLPANSTHGVQIGSPVTVASFVQVNIVPRWIKVRTSAAGTGTLYAVLAGSK
jgi:hypothetical protein